MVFRSVKWSKPLTVAQEFEILFAVLFSYVLRIVFPHKDHIRLCFFLQYLTIGMALNYKVVHSQTHQGFKDKPVGILTGLAEDITYKKKCTLQK